MTQTITTAVAAKSAANFAPAASAAKTPAAADLLRDMAFVLNLTRQVRDAIYADVPVRRPSAGSVFTAQVVGAC